ncbi:hypothetical protein DVH05_017222 [Phytophthora capsici]|nr:hypothetical protein DVH05_017222 [Phytophthora capsici]
MQRSKLSEHGMPQGVGLTAGEKQFVVNAHNFFTSARKQGLTRRGRTRDIAAECLGLSSNTVKRVMRDFRRQQTLPFEVGGPDSSET